MKVGKFTDGTIPYWKGKKIKAANLKAAAIHDVSLKTGAGAAGGRSFPQLECVNFTSLMSGNIGVASESLHPIVKVGDLRIGDVVTVTAQDEREATGRLWVRFEMPSGRGSNASTAAPSLSATSQGQGQQVWTAMTKEDGAHALKFKVVASEEKPVRLECVLQGQVHKSPPTTTRWHTSPSSVTVGERVDAVDWQVVNGQAWIKFKRLEVASPSLPSSVGDIAAPTALGNSPFLSLYASPHGPRDGSGGSVEQDCWTSAISVDGMLKFKFVLPEAQRDSSGAIQEDGAKDAPGAQPAIDVSGQELGDVQHRRMGKYYHIGRVSDRPAYKHESSGLYMYFANNKGWWCIGGSKDRMLQSRSWGKMIAEDDAMLPWNISAPWQAQSDTEGDFGFVSVPKVKVERNALSSAATQSGEKGTVYISRRWHEAQSELKALQTALRAENISVITIPLEDGEEEDLPLAVAEGMEQADMFIIMGTETYGRNNHSSINTYQELQHIKASGKPYFLFNMNPEESLLKFKEENTNAVFDLNAVSSERWALGEPIPPNAVGNILEKLMTYKKDILTLGLMTHIQGLEIQELHGDMKVLQKRLKAL
jgi:hypothetical protein